MKKILIPAIISVVIFSCTKNLEELNINKTSPTSVNPTFLLNNAILSSSFNGASVMMDMGVVQQIVTPYGGVLAGANFNSDIRDNTGSLWHSYYQNAVKHTYDIISTTRDNPDRSNLYNMARIFRAFAYLILTDEYGDIPYTEGGAGYKEQIFFPSYVKQSDIYADIIKELKEAEAALDNTKTIESADLLFAGNVTKWKKFANSVLLRAGMRLSKVDAARAQAIVQELAGKDLILNNEDNAYVRHDVSYTMPIGSMLNSTEAANFYLTKPFVDHLKNTNDPRLSSIAIRYKGAKSGPEQTVASSSNAAIDQIGMPMGFNSVSIVAQAQSDGLASLYDYSQADRRRVVKSTSPTFYVTASQTKLLLAEARFRGWITNGSAEQYYEEAIAAHMGQMAQYDAASAVAPGDQATYISTHPLEPGKELEQINTQYWISSFLNGPEAFANFRRSGFPDLTPNPYGQPNNPDVPQGTFIRRMTYPLSELSSNADHLNAAIANQGPDKLSTRIWWDKP